jgi:hypothetical protein
MKAIQAGQRQQIVATVLYARLHSKRGNGAKLDLGPGIASKVTSLCYLHLRHLFRRICIFWESEHRDGFLGTQYI